MPRGFDLLGLPTSILLTPDRARAYREWQDKFPDAWKTVEEGIRRDIIRDAWDYHGFRLYADPGEYMPTPLEVDKNALMLSKVCEHPIHPAHGEQAYCPVCEIEIECVFLDLVTAAGKRHCEHFGWTGAHRIREKEPTVLTMMWQKSRLRIAQKVVQFEGLVKKEEDWEWEYCVRDKQLFARLNGVNSAAKAVRYSRTRTNYPSSTPAGREFDSHRKSRGVQMEIDSKKTVSFVKDVKPEIPYSEVCRRPSGDKYMDTSFLSDPGYNFNQFKVWVTHDSDEYELTCAGSRFDIAEDWRNTLKVLNALPLVPQSVLATQLYRSFDKAKEDPDFSPRLRDKCKKGNLVVAFVEKEKLKRFDIIETPDFGDGLSDEEVAKVVEKYCMRTKYRSDD